MGVGSAATNAASSAAAQYIDTGHVNIWEVLKQAALGGFGAALNQQYYGRTCFVAGTPLLWEHGHKPIEEFKVSFLRTALPYSRIRGCHGPQPGPKARVTLTMSLGEGI